MSGVFKQNGPVTVRGRLTVPGDKSISHRALIYTAMAEGSSLIVNMLASADCLSTLACLRDLGVEIELLPAGPGERAPRVRVEGRGRFGFKEPSDVLDVGNSGTALRVLPGALAAQDFICVLTGDESIRRRPVDRIIKPLSLMGADIRARSGDRLAPLVVLGKSLRGIEYTLPVASAQVKTAVLTAGLLAEGDTTVIEPVASRDHTEIMLDYLGAAITVAGDNAGGRRVTVRPGPFGARDIHVPGDISSAAFFLAAATLAGEDGLEIVDIGLNPTRTGFLDALTMMGAAPGIKDQRFEAGEPVGAVTARRAALRATVIGGPLIPRLIDELPLVALMATQAEGTTEIKDAAELRVKETDRIGLVAAELNKMGADVVPTDDGFVIHGPTPLRGAVVHSYGDHRLAMMAAVASLIASGETVVEGADAVDVSFPDFFRKLGEIVNA